MRLSNISLGNPQVRRAPEVAAFAKAARILESCDYDLGKLRDDDQKPQDRHPEEGVVVVNSSSWVGSLEFEQSSGEIERSEFLRRYDARRVPRKQVNFQRQGDIEEFSVRDFRRDGLAGFLPGEDYRIERNPKTDTLVSFRERGVLSKLARLPMSLPGFSSEISYRNGDF